MNFYHGGVKNLKIGDLILPPSKTGKSNARKHFTPEQIRQGFGLLHQVYITTDLIAAKAYASVMPLGDVYIVEPVGKIEPDIDAPDISFCCDAAIVVSIVQRRVKFKMSRINKM